MPFELTWIEPPVPGRTLFLVFAYHGRDRDRPGPSVIERLEGAGSHGHRIVHRDHYANPRTFEYQMAMVATAAAQLSPDAPVDVIIDSRHDKAGDAWTTVDLSQPQRWRDSPAAHAREYQNVVAVYADALGLGCQRAEARLIRECGSIIVINGRRRAFRVDGWFAQRLDVHRVLASTRIVERLMAVAVRPFALALAAVDRVANRTA